MCFPRFSHRLPPESHSGSKIDFLGKPIYPFDGLVDYVWLGWEIFWPKSRPGDWVGKIVTWFHGIFYSFYFSRSSQPRLSEQHSQVPKIRALLLNIIHKLKRGKKYGFLWVVNNLFIAQTTKRIQIIYNLDIQAAYKMINTPIRRRLQLSNISDSSLNSSAGMEIEFASGNFIFG